MAELCIINNYIKEIAVILATKGLKVVKGFC